MPRWLRILCLGVMFSTAQISWAGTLDVFPVSVSLDSPESSQQLQVTSEPDGHPVDFTRQVQYTSSAPDVATVDAEGLVVPKGDGTAVIQVTIDGQSVAVPVTVTGQVTPNPISFEHQIIPILTKAGCNSGGCHGKAEGQNGFKLSVFGYDAVADYEAIVKTGRGRRIFPRDPEQSLLIRKGAAAMPHGGGRKITEGGLWHKRLLRWISEGTPFDTEEVPPVVGIEVRPAERVLLAGGNQQLQVTAVDAAGNRHCVTIEAEFSSNAETIAGVDSRGWIQASEIPGEAAILVRYMGHVAVCRITLPRPGTNWERPAESNFIDGMVWNKLEKLGIPPSGPADDATFVRRVFLDTIGTLPTPEEARAFLADNSPDKRAKLIDALLVRPEYADYWTMRWSDILRVDRDSITAEGAVAFTRWLRTQLAENRHYDEIVREILTATGSTTAESPAAFYKALKTPEELSRSVSQVFLGVRIECAQCHHHPFERWGQDDYFALAGFFTGVNRKNLPTGAQAIFSRGGADLKHPRTQELVAARGLGGSPLEFAPGEDRRVALANWMTTPENPFFAKSIANRLWAHYFGRGLVEPLDDIRETNPASNEPLLEALSKQLVAADYDLREFTRVLLNSQVYQLSSDTLPDNIDDHQNFSHFARKTLPAEVLLDAISQATDVPEKFDGWPAGYRAIQIWDNRMPSYFFTIFGRPVRASVCECERSSEPSISQALHLMNSPEIVGKIQDRKGRVRKLVASEQDPEKLTDELFLAALSRFPTMDERKIVDETLAELSGDRRAAFEDILWALLNTKEFLYNH